MEEQNNTQQNVSNPKSNGNTLLVLIFAGLVLVGAAYGAKKLLRKANQKTPTTSTSQNLRNVAMDELSKHASKEDCWVAIDGKVYDVTKMIPFHKGGEKAVTDWCGKDGSEAFNNRGGKGPHAPSALENLAKMAMGLLEVKK